MRIWADPCGTQVASASVRGTIRRCWQPLPGPTGTSLLQPCRLPLAKCRSNKSSDHNEAFQDIHVGGCASSTENARISRGQAQNTRNTRACLALHAIVLETEVHNQSILTQE